MNVTAYRTRIFREGDELINFITRHIRRIPERSVLVVTSKIVALSEGRTVVVKNSREKDRLIRRESDLAVRTKYCWLTIKDGMVMANAGIDESNANGKIVLLPKDSFATANFLRRALCKIYQVKHFGVIISDSRVVPLRAGVTGVAIGYAGIRGVRDYRGKKDIFGRKLHITQTNVVDSVATAATLVAGEGNERQPLALVKGAPVVFTNRVQKKEIHISPKDDMYRPLIRGL